MGVGLVLNMEVGRDGDGRVRGVGRLGRFLHMQGPQPGGNLLVSVLHLGLTCRLHRGRVVIRWDLFESLLDDRGRRRGLATRTLLTAFPCWWLGV